MSFKFKILPDDQIRRKLEKKIENQQATIEAMRVREDSLRSQMIKNEALYVKAYKDRSRFQLEAIALRRQVARLKKEMEMGKETN